MVSRGPGLVCGPGIFMVEGWFMAMILFLPSPICDFRPSDCCMLSFTSHMAGNGIIVKNTVLGLALLLSVSIKR